MGIYSHDFTLIIEDLAATVEAKVMGHTLDAKEEAEIVVDKVTCDDVDYWKEEGLNEDKIHEYVEKYRDEIIDKFDEEFDGFYVEINI